MKVSLNWLKEYVEIDLSPETLADKLTRSGTAVDYITYLGEEITGVVTGKVTEIMPHPEADKLWVCKLDIGESELLQIVTGADNVRQGFIVPVAQIGSTLPGGKKMKKAKLRGIESQGMLCSASELNIEDKLLQPEERNGIFILPVATPLGVDIKEILGLDDYVLELDLTANRGDCLSMIGVAREVAAITGNKINYPSTELKEEGYLPEKDISIQIDNPELCSRFTARLCTDINIQPSPLWLQNRLRAAGMRPISNVVDVTNYVMLEMGQPSHAYDSETLTDNTIIVRLSKSGEKLTTLDDTERTLAEDMLVIADREKCIGLAGVMGGLHTEISAATKYVVLEAACFDPIVTRKTSRALGLASEASSRFVHGIDRENMLTALDRIAHLLEQTNAAKIVPNSKDNYPNKYQVKKIATSAAAINSRLGTTICLEHMLEILTNLGFVIAEQQGESFTAIVPTWRNDVIIAADISEEIARINGYENIMGTLPTSLMLQGKESKLSILSFFIKKFLTSAGLNEVISYSFINKALLDKLNLSSNDSLYKTISLVNPITDDFKVMRTTLLASMLSTVEYNVARRNADVAVFEIGNTYIADKFPLTDFPCERAWLCAALTGNNYNNDWNKPKGKVDFYDVKGIIEELFEKLNIKDYQLLPATADYLHPSKSAVIKYQEKIIGWLGCLHPKVAQNFKIDDTYIIELALDGIEQNAMLLRQYEKLAKYPQVFRDLSLTVPVAISHDQIVQTLKQSGGVYLTDIKLFDLYTGKQIQEGYKSMSYAFSFQSDDRTLTDEEVNTVIDSMIAKLEQDLQIKLR